MDLEARAAAQAARLGGADAQENADPNRGEAGRAGCVATEKSAVKALTAPPTLAPVSTAKPACPPQSADCHSALQSAAAKRPRTAEEAAATSSSPVRLEGDNAGPKEMRESENLAWMDMMLALLENKYGPRHAIPIPLADLESARMLQPRSKKRRTSGGGAGEAADRNRSPDAALLRASDASAPAESARLALEREDKAREERRVRLLLRHAQQIQDSSMRSSASCGCKKGCLKMYCVCFSSRGFCHAGCSCDDCRNSRANKEQRLEAIQSYLANDPRAFAYSSRQQSASTSGFLQLLPQKSNAVVQRGCRCKKSKCLKKYCECFQNGIACTAHCRCVDCSNHSEAALHRSQAAKRAAASSSSAPFHPVQVTVTKVPKRNHVRKSVRLSL